MPYHSKSDKLFSILRSEKAYNGPFCCCSCPAFGDFGFCKHLVATGLAANALDTDGSKAIAGRTEELRRYLIAQGAEALAARLLAIADRDPLLRQALELDMATVGDDGRPNPSWFGRRGGALRLARRTESPPQGHALAAAG